MDINKEIDGLKDRVNVLEKADISRGKDIETLIKRLDDLCQKIDKFSNLLIGVIVTGFVGGLIGLVFFLAQQGIK